MKRGDRVVYLADPLLYGVGAIVRCLRDGRLLVEWDREDFEDDNQPLQLPHSAHDLVLESEWEPVVDAHRAFETDIGEGMGC